MPSKPKASPKRISPREAAERAQEHLAGVLGYVSNVVVEETELDGAEQFWFITLSYHVPGGLLALQREYKIFKVDAYTGGVKSMKIRRV